MTSTSPNKNLPNIALKEVEVADKEKILEPLRKNIKEKSNWTDDEVATLNHAVEKHGFAWKKILRKYKNRFEEGRRVVDLKTKYDQIHKKSSYYKTNKKDWIMINEHEDPEVDALGEIIVISQRFPYDAAKKFAKKIYLNGERQFKIRVREAENINNVHVYEFVDYDRFSNRFKLKKLVYRK